MIKINQILRASLAFAEITSRSPTLNATYRIGITGSRNIAALALEVPHRRQLSTTRIKQQMPEEEMIVKKTLDKGEPRPLYLDAQSTTALDPRVLDAMLPYLTTYYGNPHSRTHAYGWESEAAMEKAREQIADLVGADPKEIIFTSGATESNNISCKGVARFYKSKKNHIITTQTEHKCVLDSCRILEAEGFEVTYLPVQQNGRIDLDEFKNAIRPGKTVLASVMMINNEIGVIQPVEEIGKICRDNKIFFHTDAAQAVGKIPVDVNSMNIDLMSISGHKIYGPKGVGALYVRRRPRVRVEPIQNGGGQERGLRSGTVPTPLVVGLGAACELANREMEYDHQHVKRLSDMLVQGVTSQLQNVVRNGGENVYPGCVNLSFHCVEGESMLMAMKDVALSSGSACTSASLEPSYVLRALGAEEDMAHSSIRFGIGRFTTEEEVRYTVARTVREVEQLREMSPLWDMAHSSIRFGIGR